jgi:hypothetical protein
MVVKTLPIPSTKPSDPHPLQSRKPFRLSKSGIPSFMRFIFLIKSIYSNVVSSLPDHRSEERHLPDAADLRRMCIITKNDLTRIYDSLDRRQRDKDAVRQEIERKNELAERSAQVTKHWPNTIIVNKSVKFSFEISLYAGNSRT